MRTFSFPRFKSGSSLAGIREANYPSEKVTIIADRDRVRWEGGSGSPPRQSVRGRSCFEFRKTLLADFNQKPVLNIPWGSFYVLKIVNRLKLERQYLDKVRPVGAFVIFGLLTDPLFT